MVQKRKKKTPCRVTRDARGNPIIKGNCKSSEIKRQLSQLKYHEPLIKYGKETLKEINKPETYDHAMPDGADVRPDLLGVRKGEGIKLEAEPVHSIPSTHTQKQIRTLMQIPKSGLITGYPESPCIFPITSISELPPNRLCSTSQIIDYKIEETAIRNFITLAEQGKICTFFQNLSPQMKEILRRNSKLIKQKTGKCPKEWANSCKYQTPSISTPITNPLETNKSKANQLGLNPTSNSLHNPFKSLRYSPPISPYSKLVSNQKLSIEVDSLFRRKNKFLEFLKKEAKKNDRGYLRIQELSEKLSISEEKIIEWIEEMLFQSHFPALYDQTKKILYLKILCPSCEKFLEPLSHYCNYCGEKISNSLQKATAKLQKNYRRKEDPFSELK